MASKTEQSYIHQIICLSGFLDLFGVALVLPFLPTHLKSLALPEWQRGFVLATYGASQFLSGPVVGSYSDVADRKTVFIVCAFCSAISYSFLGLSAFFLTAFLARLLTGFFKHTQTISKAIVYDSLDGDDRRLLVARFNGSSSVGFILGPIVGGHLMEKYGENGFLFSCLLSSFLFVLNSTMGFLLPKKRRRRSDESEDLNLGDTIAGGKVFLRRLINPFCNVSQHNVWDLFFVKFLGGCSVLIFRYDLSNRLNEFYDASPKITGYITSYGAIAAAFFSSFVIERISPTLYPDQKLTLLYHTTALHALALFLLSTAANLPFYVCFVTLMSFTNALNRVNFTEITLDRGGGEVFAELLGLCQSVMSVSRIFSPIVAGFAHQFFGANGPPFLAVLMAALSTASIRLFLCPKEYKKKRE